MFPLPIFGGSNTDADAKPPLVLFNTLSRKKERFTPLKPDHVRMYNCGPTVYDYAHIGNLRAYVFVDVLRRALLFNGYKVKQVMNLTDVGHLTSDTDEGDDKMVKGLKREGLPVTLDGMEQLANMYTDAFLEDLDALLIKRPSNLPRATDHIDAMVALIETLLSKEYAYETSDGVYFDTMRFAGYGKLGNVAAAQQLEGARVETHPEKRSQADFALWKKSDEMGWNSPWGKGFPGWHIECSAMSMQYLGKELDIHTGGVDHIGTHHNNEIAQSEAATGKPFARFWLHNEHLAIEGAKIAKSAGNAITLRHLTEHGHKALGYRYWLLTSHYRSPITFSFSALTAAETALARLHRFFFDVLKDERGGSVSSTFREQLLLAINDDLDTPKAIATLWNLVKDDSISLPDKRSTMLLYDKVLGLGIAELLDRAQKGETLGVLSVDGLPTDIQDLVEAREQARKEKRWNDADVLRDQLAERGYTIEDSNTGPVVHLAVTRG